uniref:tRNA-dihydrouridine47 synthase NADP+-like n=1 Tax=Rhizophora mucronata TaxID=61149 RepID=A0A2P2L4K0_RHIMU
MFFIRIGFVRREDPAPLLTTMSIGQPIFISIKSTLHS